MIFTNNLRKGEISTISFYCCMFAYEFLFVLLICEA
jgi:hypothetical protein